MPSLLTEHKKWSTVRRQRAESATYGVSGISLQRKPRFIRECTSSLSTSRNQTYIVSKLCADSAGFGTSSKSLEQQSRYSGEATFPLRIKRPSLLNDRKQTYSACTAQGKCARWGVSENSLERKPRSSREDSLFFKYSALYYRPTLSKLTSFVGHARRVLGVGFQEYPSHRYGHTAEKLNYRVSKVSFIIYRSQPNSKRLYGMCGKYEGWRIKEIARKEAELQTRRHFDLQLMCS
jgi:hypothetical protein